MATAQPNKDTVYVDVDDEITTIIDKVRASNGRIVALVLPKRATVLQSIVNMKLLKRSADTAKKQLVLITTEAGLLPLAGTVGLHVAESLQSKPEVPNAPLAIKRGQEEESLSLEDEPEAEYTAENAGDKPVGELAGKAGSGFVVTSGVETETPLATAKADLAKEDQESKKKSKPNKKLAVPNFNKFRLRLVLAGALLLGLIVFLYLAAFVLPKATIAISTDTEEVNSSIGLSLDTTASDFDLARANLPATAVQQQKTYTKEVPATGEQNNGKRATGSVDMSVQKCAPDLGTPNSVPGGTGISANGNTYITQETASFAFDEFVSGSCARYVAEDIDIVAQDGGTDYNVGSTSFGVNGRSDVDAQGSASGGTDDIIRIVSQDDIDGAKNQIDTKDPEIQEALYQQLTQNNLFPIRVTFQASEPNVSSDKQPGDKADKVKVTATITYTMFGTEEKYLKELVKDDVSQQVDTEKQGISNYGLDQATFTVEDVSDTVARLSMENTAFVGPEIKTDELKKQVAGQKSGPAEELIGQTPGVTDVSVKLSPFWVSSIPKNIDKITVTVDNASTSN